MRSLVPMLRKSHSVASRSGMSAALGVSTITPSGSLDACGIPSRVQLRRCTSAQIRLAARSSATPEISGNRICIGPTAPGAVEGAQLGPEHVLPLERVADRPQPHRRVGAARDAHRRRQLVAAQVQRAERDRPPADALERRDRVRVLLVLGGQLRALEVEELGAEQPDRLGAQIDGDRDLLEHLDVRLQVNRRAVDRLGRHVADRRQPVRARALHLGARLVAAQRLVVGIEDHLAAHRRR